MSTSIQWHTTITRKDYSERAPPLDAEGRGRKYEEVGGTIQSFKLKKGFKKEEGRHSGTHSALSAVCENTTTIFTHSTTHKTVPKHSAHSTVLGP